MRALSQQLGVPAVDLDKLTIDPSCYSVCQVAGAGLRSGADRRRTAVRSTWR